jgi:hypothetical protein
MLEDKWMHVQAQVQAEVLLLRTKFENFVFLNFTNKLFKYICFLFIFKDHIFTQDIFPKKERYFATVIFATKLPNTACTCRRAAYYSTLHYSCVNMQSLKHFLHEKQKKKNAVFVGISFTHILFLSHTCECSSMNLALQSMQNP